MAVSTYDTLVASFAAARKYPLLKTGTAPEAVGVPYAFLKDAGNPGAIVVGTPGLNGRNVDGTTEAGAIPWVNAGGANQKYLGSFSGSATVACQVALIDLLWINSGLVVATLTAQAITQAALPARDDNGATLGQGVQVGLLVTTATTNAAAITNMTISYTNSAGTAGRTGTAWPNFPATAVVGTLVPFALQAGDAGVRSVQSVTFGTSLAAGSVSLIMYRNIAELPLPTANLPALMNWADVALPKLYNGTALVPIIVPSAVTAVTFTGSLTVLEG